MNVAFDDWIPVVTTAGKRQLASLCEVLTNGEQFADLAVRPHERVALMRLFLCVAHAALDGPKDYDEWREVPSRLPAAARQYLEKWRGCVRVVSSREALVAGGGPESDALRKEDADSDDEKGWTNVKKLSFTRASGNNTTLFDHGASSREISECPPHELALNLLAFQNYFVAGGKASSRMWGKQEMKNPANPKGGPCVVASRLFTHFFEGVILRNPFT